MASYASAQECVYYLLLHHDAAGRTCPINTLTEDRADVSEELPRNGP